MNTQAKENAEKLNDEEGKEKKDGIKVFFEVFSFLFFIFSFFSARHYKSSDSILFQSGCAIDLILCSPMFCVKDDKSGSGNLIENQNEFKSNER